MENENQKLIDITSYPIVALLDKLLEDKTTKKNIIWATDAYASFGDGFQDKNQILSSAFIMGRSLTIRPRIEKNLEEQQLRTKKKAEVFTPAWLCNQMNNYLDEDWFGNKNIFNVENKDNTWTYNTNKIIFNKNKSWEDYIKIRCLEITCGEAPFLVSRYDTSTGILILPPFNRIGLIDRKLRVINENIDNEEDWIKWASRAYQNTYGFEYQGDNLLIARINLLLTFIDYFKDKFNKEPDLKLLQKITNIIAWNIWQMDGLKDTVPLGKPFVEHEQIGLDLFGDVEKEKDPATPCVIKDWRANKTLLYMDCKENNMSKKLFDYVIGNPPYNEEFGKSGDNKTFAAPVYDKFMSATFLVSSKVELIHPARFLFNAGSTPKQWNKEMLNDKHFKILKYFPYSTNVFANTDIKGGIAVSFHNDEIEYEKIETFIPYDEMKTCSKKIINCMGFESISEQVINSYAYHFTDALYKEKPNLIGKMSNGHEFDFKSNVFDTMPEAFSDYKLVDESIRVLGRKNNKREYKYIKQDYVNKVKNLYSYKVFIPRGSGTGEFGEEFAPTLIGYPYDANTETFLSIGNFKTEKEALNTSVYIKTKFARALLSIMKVTQLITPSVWKYVPLQDFTSNSDIDWSKSIHEIDLQLYKKYGLDEKEIEFIETHVKEMN